MKPLTVAIINNDFRTFVTLRLKHGDSCDCDHCLYGKTKDCDCEHCEMDREIKSEGGFCDECQILKCLKRKRKNCTCIMCDLEKGYKCECEDIEEEDEKICGCFNRKNKRLNNYEKEVAEEVEKKYDNEYRAACIAAYYGRIRMLKFLMLTEDPECIYMAFIAACDGGRLKTVKYIVSLGINLDNYYCNSLCYAIRDHRTDMVEFLLENNADVSSNENTPIVAAVKCEYLEGLKIMIEEYKGDVTLYDNRVIKAAEDDCNIKILKYLLLKGGDFNKLSEVNKGRLLQSKYYRKWRKIVFKNFINKVVTPLYYSSGFIGGEKEKKELRLI